MTGVQAICPAHNRWCVGVAVTTLGRSRCTIQLLPKSAFRVLLNALRMPIYEGTIIGDKSQLSAVQLRLVGCYICTYVHYEYIL